MIQLPISAFATKAWDKVSSKYSFLSTFDVVTALASIGLLPYSARQSGTRIEGKEGYTKHIIRFRNPNTPMLVGNLYPEVILVNSHDTASSFYLNAGLFRIWCSNGLVVSFGDFGSFIHRHVGVEIAEVIQSARQIVGQFPAIEEHVAAMQARMLTDLERETFSIEAMALRFTLDKQPYNPVHLLQTRRTEDTGRDLWSTFNVIQENLMRGQSMRFRGQFFHQGEERQPRTTTEIKSIDKEMSINKRMWELAKRFLHI